MLGSFGIYLGKLIIELIIVNIECVNIKGSQDTYSFESNCMKLEGLCTLKMGIIMQNLGPFRTWLGVRCT